MKGLQCIANWPTIEFTWPGHASLGPFCDFDSYRGITRSTSNLGPESNITPDDYRAGAIITNKCSTLFNAECIYSTDMSS